MTICVYIPTKDRRELLSRAIDSVLSQTVSINEIIIVDDCSSYNVSALINERYPNNNNIKLLINQESKGACYSRNIAIQASSSKWVTGLDDDDYFEVDRIANLLKYCSENKLDAAFSGYKYLTRSSLRKCYLSTYQASAVTYYELLRCNVVGNQIFAKKEVYISSGLFDIKLNAWQDFDMWLRVCKNLGEIGHLHDHSYIVDKSHSHESISKDVNKVLASINYLKQKYHPDIDSSVSQGWEQMSLYYSPSIIRATKLSLKYFTLTPFKTYIGALLS